MDSDVTAAAQEKEERPSPAFYIIVSVTVFYMLTQVASCEAYWMQMRG